MHYSLQLWMESNKNDGEAGGFLNANRSRTKKHFVKDESQKHRTRNTLHTKLFIQFYFIYLTHTFKTVKIHFQSGSNRTRQKTNNTFFAS